MGHAWIRKVGMVVLVGILIFAGDTYAAGNVKNSVPRVVDATGKLVGEVIGTNSTASTPNIVLNISGPSIIVQVTRNSIAGYNTLFFTTLNCTGQPYFESALLLVPHMFPVVGIVNNIVYGPPADSPPVGISYLSYWSTASQSCTLSTGALTAIIADPIIDLSTQFTPPYRFVYP